MYYEEHSRTFNIVVGLACGALVAAGAALLFVPRRRERMTRRLVRAAAGTRERVAGRLNGVAGGARQAAGTRGRR